MVIVGRLVNIRAIEEYDLDYLKDIINDGDLEEMENSCKYPLSSAQQKKWFDNTSTDYANGKFIIETKEHQRVGYTCLLNVAPENRSAHTGIKLYGDGVRGRGYATDAVMAMMRYAFEYMNLHRLEGFCIDYNNNSKKLYIDRCGWKNEGIKREAIYKNNEYHDLHIMGILKSEYKELIEKKHYWD